MFWLSNASLNWGSCLKFWKISSLSINHEETIQNFMKSFLKRIYQILVGTVKYFTPQKNPPHTKPHCCYTIAAILHYCAKWISFETHWGCKWGCRVACAADWCVFDCPSHPSSPARCDWEGAMGRYGKGSIPNSSGAQLSSDSFHSAAWPQAPFLKWTQASSSPWT